MTILLRFARRNHVSQADIAIDYRVGDVAPPAGQLSVGELWSGATLVQRRKSHTNEVLLTPPGDGTYTVRLYATLNGLDSMQAHEREVFYVGGAVVVLETYTDDADDPYTDENGEPYEGY